MRYILSIAICLVPTILYNEGATAVIEAAPSYAGRGHINPPTVWEMKQMKCLATMIYGEARGETYDGKIAVAYTALNRATKRSLCDIVLAPKQYSVFNGNAALRSVAKSLLKMPRLPNIIEERAWARAEEVAKKVVRRSVPDPTNGATHYLAPVAMKELGYPWPRWAKEYDKVAVVDNHHFYKK